MLDVTNLGFGKSICFSDIIDPLVMAVAVSMLMPRCHPVSPSLRYRVEDMAEAPAVKVDPSGG